MNTLAVAAAGLRIARVLTASVSLSLLLGGCIASYSIRHEDPIDATPDATQVCRYNWSADEPFFRSANIISYQWAPASHFGHHDFAGVLHDLTAECPASNSADRPDARISAHALRHVNVYTRSVMAIPMAFAMGYTLGFIPISTTDYFAVCMEITSADGLRRAAIAHGQLDRFANVWGSSNHRHNRGKDRQRQELDLVIREVTVQAWRKAWNPAQSGSGTLGDCRKTLDAIAQ